MAARGRGAAAEGFSPSPAPRSDTVTRPCAGMSRAMARAAVGDDDYGEDPAVNELQRLAAGVPGMEEALSVPTATMANLIAVMCHCQRRGAQLLLGRDTHLHLFEHGGAAQLSAAGRRAPATGWRGPAGPLQRQRGAGRRAAGCCPPLAAEPLHPPTARAEAGAEWQPSTAGMGQEGQRAGTPTHCQCPPTLCHRPLCALPPPPSALLAVLPGAQVARVHSQTLPDLPDGTFDLDQLELTIREAHGSRYHPRPELLCLENTHSSAGGWELPLAYLQQIGARSPWLAAAPPEQPEPAGGHCTDTGALPAGSEQGGDS
ncbi:LOW QUALITY PROTEIN: uncharacterized protein LOC127391750 [Apus apus]|uniref:LOW QUALITY PROTEIN: uncharacterized protein LOC127391750 n=1 Tax=Apus apus TaxID=8895 RepID=UPI0021F89463|nr:LOW QUALITY PROTEIN: uncharacterized protein LOC127391750 [Apus apus]